MTERQQTIVCAFDQRSPRVSAFDIHECVYGTLHLQEHEVVMIQIDGPCRHVYIKFRDPQRMQAILTAIQGQEDFRHENGEISKVRIETVGLGMRQVREASLPPKWKTRPWKWRWVHLVKYVIFSRKYGQMPIAIGFPIEYVW